MRHIVLISGKDSATLAIELKRRHPELPVEYIFNPTGAELPEVFDWMARMEAYLGQEIRHVGEDLPGIIEDEGILPSVKCRFCSRKSKIEPLQADLGNDPAVVYFGLRADEQRTGYQPRIGDNIIPAYPLRDWGIGLEDVWRILNELDLLPPAFFWQRLHDRVCEILGPYRTLVEDLPRPLFQRLFAGRSRMNCSFCFFQALYEWIWLHETHPVLFWGAATIEETTGGKNYHWRSDYSLRQVLLRADEILEKRARKIVAFLLKRAKVPLFVEDESDEMDGLQVVSCGLICGK